MADTVGVGSLRQARPATMAMCPHAQLIAVAPKAGLGAGDSGSSRLQIAKLWQSKDDPPIGRHLEVVADMPFADGDLHRLAWSRNNDRTEYRVGLLAGGFDGGVVIWKARDLTYRYRVNDIRYFEVPKFDKPNNTYIRKNALDISRIVERIYMNQVDETLNDCHIVEDNCKTEVGDWELVENMKPAAIIRHESSGKTVDFENPSLLKIADLEGPVHGLAFNNQYTNMLAAAGKADKLNIYHIDYSAKYSTRKYEFADSSEKAKDARVTFLEWHPDYAAILASTCDAGITTIWDIRRKKPVLRFEDTNQHCTEVHWSPIKPQHLAVSSIGQSSDTVKIWDLGKPDNDKISQKSPIANFSSISQFGPARGVTSLSWSFAYNLILTTDVDGATDCWSVDGKERVGLSGDDWVSLEARWCETRNHEFAVSTTTGVELCSLPQWRIRDGI